MAADDRGARSLDDEASPGSDAETMTFPRLLPARAMGLLGALPALVVLGLTGCAAATPVAECANVAAVAEPVGNGSSWPETLDHASTPETHRRAVRELLDAMEMEDALNAALESSIKTQMEVRPQLRQFEPLMRKFMSKYLNVKAMEEPLTRLYVQRFSELELVQLTAFYRTPLGVRTRVELPKLIEEGGKIGQALVQEHMEELKELVRAQIEGRGED